MSHSMREVRMALPAVASNALLNLKPSSRMQQQTQFESKEAIDVAPLQLLASLLLVYCKGSWTSNRICWDIRPLGCH